MSGHFRRPTTRAVIAATLVLVFIAVIPGTPAPAVDLKRLLVHLAGPVLLLLTLRTRTIGALLPRQWSPLTCLWLLLAGLNVAAALGSRHPANGLVHASWPFSLFLLHLVSSHAFHTPRHAECLLRAVVFGALCTTAYGAVQYCGIDPFPWTLNEDTAALYARLPATFGNPNLAGHVLVIAVLAGGYRAVTRPSLPACAVVGVLGLHLAMTGHRAGLLALLVASCFGLVAPSVFGLLQTTQTPRRAWLRFVGVLCVVAGLAVPVLLYAGRSWPADQTVLLRANAAYGAARMMLDAPLLGVGPGNYEIESPRYWTALEQEEYRQRNRYNAHVHNEPLQASVDAGLGAGAALVVLLLTSVCAGLRAAYCTASRRRRNLAIAFAALFLGFAIDGCFGFNLFAPASGALFACLTGAFDGVFLRRLPRPAPAPAGTWPVYAMLLPATLSALFGVSVFAAQHCRQEARMLAATGDLEHASARLAWSQRLAPWDWRCAHDAGIVAMSLGCYSDAMLDFQRALRLNPNHIPSLLAAAHACRAILTAQPHLASARRDAVRYTLRALALCPALPGGP